MSKSQHKEQQTNQEEFFTQFVKQFNTDKSQTTFDKTGFPPLHRAMELKDRFLDRILKLSNLDLTVRAKNGQTALHRAVEIHNFSAATKLLEHKDHGKIINAQDREQDEEIGGGQNTPLHILVTRTILGKSIEEQKKLISLMIEKGADLQAKNQDGETPLDTAIKYGSKEIALHMIEECKAKNLIDEKTKPLIYKLAKENRHDYDLPEIASTMKYTPPALPEKEVVVDLEPTETKKAVTKSPELDQAQLKEKFIEKLKTQYEKSDPQLFGKLQNYINKSTITQDNGNITITPESNVTSGMFAKMISGMRSTDEDMVKEIATEFQEFVKDPQNKTTISLPSRYSSKKRKVEI